MDTHSSLLFHSSTASSSNESCDFPDDGRLTLNLIPTLARPIIGDFSSNTTDKVPCLLHLLRYRELFGQGSYISGKIRYRKPLYKMNVCQMMTNSKTKQVTTEISPIDKKGMYLGLSHDSAHLVELCVEGLNPPTILSMLDCDAATGDETTFRFVIHLITPQYLFPRYVLDLGPRSLLSVFYAGFSLNQELFVSHCFKQDFSRYFAIAHIYIYNFSSVEHKYFNQGTYTDSVYIDVALLRHSIHVSFQIIVNNTVKKRKLAKHSYFRIFNSGFLFDTGTEIVAVTFSHQLSDETCDSEQTYSIQLRDYDSDVHRNRLDLALQGIFLRNISVHGCASTRHPNSSIRVENCVSKAPIYEVKVFSRSNKDKVETNEPMSFNSRRWNSPLVYMTETFLSSERVINTVVRSILKTKLQHHKFMGITASEAYVVGVNEHIATVLVIGVIEVQSTRYVFSRLAIEVDWDLRKPGKMTLINLSMKEINWLTATRGDWQPVRLPLQRNVEDRLMTNDVTESLSYIAGSYSGGMIFTA